MLSALLFPLLALVACGGGEPAYVTESLGDGITLYRPVDEIHGTNSIVVERSDGLLVVDAQPTPQAAARLLERIEARHEGPIRYLILTHAHAEAGGGASAFPSSTLVVASEDCVQALADPETDFGGEMPWLLGSESWTDPPRPTATIVLRPAGGRFDDARNPVEVYPVVKSHGRGELMVVLPKIDLYHLGGIAFGSSHPFAGDSNVGNWLNTLNSVIRRQPALVVSTRGPVQDLDALRRQRDALAWVRSQVSEGFVDRLEVEAIVTRVMEHPDLAERFGPTDASPYLDLVVRQVIEEMLQVRRRRGL